MLIKQKNDGRSAWINHNITDYNLDNSIVNLQLSSQRIQRSLSLTRTTLSRQRWCHVK